MKIYAITIKTDSPFGTPLKGDTIFGHFCWQAAHDAALLRGGLDTWIGKYKTQPFAVFSSAWPQIERADGKTFFCLPRPTMPASFAGITDRCKRVEERKEDKKKKWLLLERDNLHVDLSACAVADDKKLYAMHLSSRRPQEQRILQFLPKDQQKPVIVSTQAHNSINRLTMTTGKGFDPFSMDNFHFLPGLQLVIFAAIDEKALDVDSLQKGFARIGQFGFGRDASSGLGRFTLGKIDELQWPLPEQGQGCYTLGPCVPEKDRYEEHFIIPFTRFGRHGDRLVLTDNPFKNPVVMADEGAVFFPHKDKQPVLPYIGEAVGGLGALSMVEKRTVAQGYSIYLPMTRREL